MLRQLATAAYVDTLTGLPNRHALHAELARLGPLHDSGFRVWLCWFDLVDFGTVNRTRGYGEGDRELRRFGARALELAPMGANVFRWGGDEFVGVALTELMPRAAMALWAERLSWTRAIRWELCVWDGGAVDVVPPIGVARNGARSENGCSEDGKNRESGILNPKVPSLALNRWI